MNPPCIYHPALAAVGPCVECGAPVCKHCAQIISNHVACPKCVETVRAKLGVPSEPTQPWPGLAAQLSPQGGHAMAPAAPAQAAPAGNPEDVLALDSTEKRRLTLAVGISLAIGIICSILILQIVYAAGADMASVGPVVGFAAMYVIAGVGVGLSFCKIADVGGEEIIAFIAAAIMLAGLIVGHIYYVCLYAFGHHDNFFTSIPAALGGMPVFHWVLVLVSLVACWATVKYQV